MQNIVNEQKGIPIGSSIHVTLGESDGCLWTLFIPLSDKQRNVMNLWITEVEKSDAGQDKIF